MLINNFYLSNQNYHNIISNQSNYSFKCSHQYSSNQIVIHSQENYSNHTSESSSTEILIIFTKPNKTYKKKWKYHQCLITFSGKSLNNNLKSSSITTKSVLLESNTFRHSLWIKNQADQIIVTKVHSCLSYANLSLYQSIHFI